MNGSGQNLESENTGRNADRKGQDQEDSCGMENCIASWNRGDSCHTL